MSEPTNKRKTLSQPQKNMLLRLLKIEGHYELTPSGNKSGIGPSNWNRMVECLTALELVSKTAEDSRARATLTEAGLERARELQAAEDKKTASAEQRWDDQQASEALERAHETLEVHTQSAEA